MNPGIQFGFNLKNLQAELLKFFISAGDARSVVLAGELSEWFKETFQEHVDFAVFQLSLAQALLGPRGEWAQQCEHQPGEDEVNQNALYELHFVLNYVEARLNCWSPKGKCLIFIRRFQKGHR